MIRRLLTSAAALALLLSTAPAQAQGGAQRMSLDDCVRTARSESEEAERADAKIDEAVAARKIARGNFGPKLMWEAGIQRWAEPVEIEFAIPEMEAFGIPPAAMTVQDATTMQMSFTAAQPVTSLWAIYEGYQAAKLGEEAARVEAKTVGQDVEKQVADAYFQALMAERFVEISQLSVDLIAAHVKRAKSLYDNELIAKNNLLEAEVRLAQAKADLIKAQGGMSLARSNLAFQMGLPADQEVAPQRIETSELSAGPIRPVADANAAETERPEIAAMKLRAQQAEAGARAAWALMLPQVNLIASAQYAKGSEFQPESGYFIGAQASWTFWEWGTTYYGIDQAEARVRQAKSGIRQLTEGTRLEVKKANIDLDSANKKLEVMRSSVKQAEENLRIVQKQFDHDVSVSTDVLDAQMLLAKARLDEALAHHEVLQARVALRRALGLKPTEGAVSR
ncbi:MAG: TolC family protein [Deltaproteobacteria bacterium]|jgi:outer membrane protein TolC|nr:TolC family protein [Deltaproteobacteria bacterium]MBW2535978.1 TolC family protein [Deltaproteobacteria bacterium]